MFSKDLSKDLAELPSLARDNFKPEEKVIFAIIEDTGCGISEENIPNIFDPFYTSRRADGGVGLGLSVSKNIMRIHQGCIFIDNREEGGVKVTLIFKAANPS